ncbi:MAG: hypothetical protein KBB98_06560, partial [Clostridia bacterium]|nr:hypothetical protein [Clostridia bacterium]
MRIIESADNTLFKSFHRLKSPHQSKKERLVIVEGIRHAADLINNQIEPDYLVFSNDERGKHAMNILEGETRISFSAVTNDKVCWL